MSVKIMSRVWEQSPQKDSRLLLTLALADNANDDGICWPSTDYLRDKIRMSKRQTQRLLDKLEETAEIWVSRPEHNGPNASNRYIVLSGMTDEQILIALEDLGGGKSGDKKTGDILGSGDILSALKKKRVTFCQGSGDISESEISPDFSLIGRREEVRRKRTTVNRTINNKEPSSDSSPTKSSPKKQSERKPRKEKDPWNYLTDSMWEGIPEEIRPVGRPHYGKNNANAEQVFKAGFTPQQVLNFVQWTYATNDWYWTGGEGGVPIIISMNAVLKGIRLSSGKVQEWIADGRPRRTQRAQESAKVEKPFDPETDPDNPKNWPFPAPPESYVRYEQMVKSIRAKENANGRTELHDAGGKDNLSSGAGIGGTAGQEPGDKDLSLVPGHGGGNPSSGN